MQARPVMFFTQRLEDAIAYDGEEGYCDEREEESLEYLFGLFLFLGFARFEFGLVLLIHSKRVLLVWLIKMLVSSGWGESSVGRKDSAAPPPSCFPKSLLLLLGELHEIGFDEAVYFAVHHAADIAGLIVGAMVLDAAVVEDVTANLAAPLYLLLARLNLGLFGASLLEGAVVELGAEKAHGVLAVFKLFARLGVFDEDFFFLSRVGVFVLIAQTYACLDLVHILTTCSTRAEEVPADF